MSIKIGIGKLRIGTGGSQSWPPFKSDVDILTRGRSGLNLTALSGETPTILLPVWPNIDANGESAYYGTSTDLDIGNTYDFTMCCWVKHGVETKQASRYFIGKGITSSVSGKYLLYSAITTGYISAYIQTSGSTYVIASTVDYTAEDWVFLRMDINQTTKKFRLFINETQVGSDTDFTGTFGTPSSDYKFMIGAGYDGSGVLKNRSLSYHSDSYIFRRLLTPTEGATLMARGYVSDPYAHWACNSGKSGCTFDSSGNGLHLKHSVNLTEYYDAAGSRYCLDKGYTLYTTGHTEAYIPNTLTGEEIAAPTILGESIAGMTKIRAYAGSSTYHNLANSMIQFADSFFDRSDETIYNSTVRATGTFYDSTDATTKKRWHITELNNLAHVNYFNTDYKGRLFIKCGDTDTYFNREKLESILLYTTNKTGSDYNTVLTACNDIPSDGIYESTELYYKVDSDNILYSIGDKLLKYDTITGNLSLSLDKGVTYPYVYNIGAGLVFQFAYIFNNGNILVAEKTSIWLSNDNLATMAAPTVKDIAGNDYTASDYAFSTSNLNDKIIINDVEMLVWGCYRTGATVADSDMNVWYSVDNGLTIKSAYKAGVTNPPNLPARHIHAINYRAEDNSWWMTTGDNNLTATDECNIIKGEYDADLDTWIWIKLYGSGTTYKVNGIVFLDANNILVGDDDTGNTTYWGLWSIAIADLADKSLCTLRYKNPTAITKNYADKNGNILAMIGPYANKNVLVSSQDGINGLKANNIFLDGGHYVLSRPVGPNNDGWYLFHVRENNETYEMTLKGRVLWVKFK